MVLGRVQAGFSRDAANSAASRSQLTGLAARRELGDRPSRA
jgi:hypothetical protein